MHDNGVPSLSQVAWAPIKSCESVTDKTDNPSGSAREHRDIIVRAAKKSPLKPDQKSTALNSKRGGADYSKKAALLEDAIAQMNAGKYGRSSAVLKELLALDPLNLEARRLFATLHLRLGSLLPARQAFETLASEALERQDYWLAESLLREYLVAGPRCVPFIEKLGIVYQEQGNELAAVEEFGKAIDILLEDPDTEHPNKPAQLYAKIRELAPVSPPAFRLANCFDAQTGELIARPAAAPAELNAPQDAPRELADPAAPEESRDLLPMPEPVSGVRPWNHAAEEEPSEDPSNNPSSGQPSDSIGWQASSPPPERAQGPIEAERDPGTDLQADDSPAGVTAEGAVDAVPMEPQAERLPAWAAPDPAPAARLSDSRPATEESPSLPENTETSANTRFSWESIFSTWKFGPASSTSKMPVYQAPAGEPRDTEVPLTPVESVAQAAVSEAETAAVQEVPVEDPAPPFVTEEAPRDSVPAADQPETAVLSSPPAADTSEPVSADPSQEVEAHAPWGDSVMETAAEPVPAAEPAIEAAPLLASLPQEIAHSVAVSPEPPVPTEEFRFISSGASRLESLAPEAVPQEVSPPAEAGAELPAPQEECRTLSSNEAFSSAVADEEGEEPLTLATLSDGPSIQPEACEAVSEGETAVLSEAPLPVSQPLLTGEEQRAELQCQTPDAISVVAPPVYEHPEEPGERSEGVSYAAAAEPAPLAVNPVEPVSLVVSAVDALFQPSGGMTQPIPIEPRPVTTPRPPSGAMLVRFGRSLFSFIGSCFSTTQALAMSLVGLVVSAGVLAALAIGAVGVAWVIMEEKPSPAFQSLTAAPQHSPMDARKNGYVLLLGFDAAAGADPMQAGAARKPGASEDEAVPACLGGPDGHSGGGPLNATASVADGWFRSSNPVAQFKTKADGLKDWIGQARWSMGRYRQWLKMPFEDGGYGQAVAPPCSAILFAHRLHVAEGFASEQPADAGIQRLQEDMEAWRVALGQAKTLPVKMLAVHAMQDDLAVASGLLVQADFDNKDLPALAKMLRPLDQMESSVHWPMQSELAAASQAAAAQLKGEHGDDVPWHVMVAKWLPLPKQRRLNEYAAYYDASSKAADEGRHGAMPKRAAYIKNPPVSAMDYLANPLENIVGLKPLPSWEQYNGMVIDLDARLRLASVQAWLRRGAQEGDVVTRIAKAGQRFYDPYTGMPMLVNLKRGVIYSVGHDGKDQDGDLRQDVAVYLPPNPASSGSAKVSVNSGKPK